MTSSSPGIREAEQLFHVRGALGEDPTEPFHSQPYPFPPVPDEPPIARARAELKGLGLHPSSLPLGVDIDAGWPAAARRGTLSRTPAPARWTPRARRLPWR